MGVMFKSFIDNVSIEMNYTWFYFIRKGIKKFVNGSSTGPEVSSVENGLTGCLTLKFDKVLDCYF